MRPCGEMVVQDESIKWGIVGTGAKAQLSSAGGESAFNRRPAIEASMDSLRLDPGRELDRVKVSRRRLRLWVSW